MAATRVGGSTVPGDFVQRIDELRRRIGKGKLVGAVVVDQVYAQNQHQSAWFKHPRGGKAFYLRDPLLANQDRYLQALASNVLNGDLTRTMAQNMEHLVSAQRDDTPVLTGALKTSGAPRVEDNGAVVYQRPPITPRLTEEQLRAGTRRFH